VIERAAQIIAIPGGRGTCWCGSNKESDAVGIWDAIKCNLHNARAKRYRREQREAGTHHIDVLLKE
jgi:hypothetical protein